MSDTVLSTALHPSCAPGRAAWEPGPRRGGFDPAVHLGRIRTVPDEGGGGRRIPPAESQRWRAEDGFPGTLRLGVRAIGTREGGAVRGVTPHRCTRPAGLGPAAAALPRPAGPGAPRKRTAYSARNRPSWTTETSRRPRTS